MKIKRFQVYKFTNNKRHQGTRPRPIHHFLILIQGIIRQEIFLRVLKPLHYRFSWVMREVRIPNHILVQMIPEEICASSATVAIVDTEYRYLRPVVTREGIGLYDIQNNRDPVLIVIPQN